MDDVLILTGFMGVGKTATGRELARLLDWEFVDLDHEIERIEGRSIPEIFAKSGEDYFRDLEFRVLAQAMSRERAVVATGGGVVLAERNRALLAGRQVLYLYASPQECLRRLRRSRVLRPLLAGTDPEARVLQIYEEREILYESTGRKVNTEGFSPEEVAGAIVEEFRVKSRRVVG